MSERKKYKRRPKLYLAILNKGWVRREILGKVLPEIRQTKRVRTFLEPLSATWGEPIFGNRNAIARRFLNSKCDYLLMMDNDIVPLFNPAVFIHAEKDVLGFPAKVRQKGRVINWVSYVQAPDDPDYYYPVDFAAIDSKADYVRCDAIGTGCIMIRRDVIQTLFDKADGNGWEAPFTITLTPDGEMKHGTDIAFSRRAKAAGFDIVSAVHFVCEHYKEVGLLDISGYDDSDFRDRSTGVYKMPWGGWAISQKDWMFMKEILGKNDIVNVLEFGAGLSSLLMSETCKVISYETNPEWAEEIRSRVTDKNNLEIRLWDGEKVEEKLPQFDLAFVDAPVGKLNGGIGRRHSTEIAAKHSDRVIIHDAGRNEETMWQFMFLRQEFKMVGKNGQHQARCNYWIRRTLIDDTPIDVGTVEEKTIH